MSDTDSKVIMGHKFRLWGKAIAGKAIWNDGGYEVVGSALSNERGERNTAEGGFAANRDNSYIRYHMDSGPDHVNTAYFGRVLFYMVYNIEGEDYLLAYVQHIYVNRVRGRKLVYQAKLGARHFLDIHNIQELVGIVKTRGLSFFVGKKSCFWPKKGFSYNQVMDNDNLLRNAV
jgi:hypothetical protein